MLDPQNLIIINGGFVADPEIINGKIFKATLAVDYAASDKNSDNNTGYFDVVYYLKDNNGFVGKNANFVSNQLESSNFKKGTQVSVVGRLLQERWKQDEGNRSKIVIIAEHISYGKSSKSSSSSTDSSATSSQVASVPNSF
jgi:single-stranded DNA-binding protein